MVVVKLKGGLGNQMFQYAAGRALAERHSVPLLLDISFLEADPGELYTKRNYELHQLNITAKIAAKEDLIKFRKHSLLQKLFRKNNAVVYHEQKSAYNKEFENLGSEVYLDGFWQTEKYFSVIRNILLKEFNPRYLFTEIDKTIENKIKSAVSVGVHVRRGDYVNLKSASEYHGACSMDYYNKAMNYIESKISGVNYYIFSDDLEWCRHNFKNAPNVIFVESNNKHSGFDLYLMSCCSHNIIANSSYSWWAAWLNRNENKIVIAPEKWFANGVSLNEDILPARYIKL